MKILTINYEYPPIGGGGALVAKDLAELFISRGHSVSVITMAYKDLPLYEEINGVKIYRVKCMRSKKSVCHPWEQLSYIYSARRFLKKHLKENTYDINHTHFIIPCGVISKWLKRNYHIPYIITAHGSDVLGHNNGRFALLYKILKGPWKNIILDAGSVVSPSAHLKELMEKNEKKGSYIIIKNGISTKDYIRSQKELRMLVMGRLQETKRVDLVIKAFAKLKLSNWNLDIVGDGPCMRELQALVTELGIVDHVVFHGWIENKSSEHLKILGRSAIYVSASEVENGPIAILEAIASGCCPIVSDIPPHRILLEDDALLFTHGDEESLYKALANIIDGKKYEHVVDMNVDWQHSIDMYLDELSRCERSI